MPQINRTPKRFRSHLFDLTHQPVAFDLVAHSFASLLLLLLVVLALLDVLASHQLVDFPSLLGRGINNQLLRLRDPVRVIYGLWVRWCIKQTEQLCTRQATFTISKSTFLIIDMPDTIFLLVTRITIRTSPSLLRGGPYTVIFVTITTADGTRPSVSSGLS